MDRPSEEQVITDDMLHEQTGDKDDNLMNPETECSEDRNHGGQGSSLSDKANEVPSTLLDTVITPDYCRMDKSSEKLVTTYNELHEQTDEESSMNNETGCSEDLNQLGLADQFSDKVDEVSSTQLDTSINHDHHSMDISNEENLTVNVMQEQAKIEDEISMNSKPECPEDLDQLEDHGDQCSSASDIAEEVLSAPLDTSKMPNNSYSLNLEKEKVNIDLKTEQPKKRKPYKRKGPKLTLKKKKKKKIIEENHVDQKMKSENTEVEKREDNCESKEKTLQSDTDQNNINSGSKVVAKFDDVSGVVEKETSFTELKEADKDETAVKENVNNKINSRRKRRVGRPPIKGEFKCSKCSYIADEKRKLAIHNKKCRPPMECHYCDYTTRTMQSYMEHEAKHTKEKPFKCSNCSYRSRYKADLYHHKAKHQTEKTHKCPHCDFVTKWKRNIHHHLLRHTNVRPFSCDLCGFSFKRIQDLNYHLYRHNEQKPIACDQCDFKCKTNYELKCHKLKHSDVRKFACTHPGCTQRVKTKSDLTKHLKIHLKIKPHICEECGKGFKMISSLNKHKQRHTDERPFSCDICQRRFKVKSSLRKHIILHSDVKPFMCDVCGHRFSNKSNMRMHMRTHEVEDRPFRCPICPHGSKTKGHLLAHIGSMHGDSFAYFCELCKKPFKRYHQLEVHYKRMHKRHELKLLDSLSNIELTSDTKDGVKVEPEDEEDAIKDEMEESNLLEDIQIDGNVTKEIDENEFNNLLNNGNYCNENNGFEPVENVTTEEKVPKKVSSLLSSCNKVDEKEDSVKIVDIINSTSCDNDKTGEDKNLNADNINIDDRKGIANDKVTDKDISGRKHASDGEHFENVKIEEGRKECVSIKVCSQESGDKQTSDEIKIDSEEKKANFYQSSPSIFDHTQATLAMYDGFRLPLATKGFEFNMDKTGKKPKSWFMDPENIPNREFREHQVKYLFKQQRLFSVVKSEQPEQIPKKRGRPKKLPPVETKVETEAKSDGRSITETKSKYTAGIKPCTVTLEKIDSAIPEQDNKFMTNLQMETSNKDCSNICQTVLSRRKPKQPGTVITGAKKMDSGRNLFESFSVYSDLSSKVIEKQDRIVKKDNGSEPVLEITDDNVITPTVSDVIVTTNPTKRGGINQKKRKKRNLKNDKHKTEKAKHKQQKVQKLKVKPKIKKTKEKHGEIMNSDNLNDPVLENAVENVITQSLPDVNVTTSIAVKGGLKQKSRKTRTPKNEKQKTKKVKNVQKVKMKPKIKKQKKLNVKLHFKSTELLGTVEGNIKSKKGCKFSELSSGPLPKTEKRKSEKQTKVVNRKKKTIKRKESVISDNISVKHAYSTQLIYCGTHDAINSNNDNREGTEVQNKFDKKSSDFGQTVSEGCNEDLQETRTSVQYVVVEPQDNQKERMLQLTVDKSSGVVATKFLTNERQKPVYKPRFKGYKFRGEYKTFDHTRNNKKILQKDYSRILERITENVQSANASATKSTTQKKTAAKPAAKSRVSTCSGNFCPSKQKLTPLFYNLEKTNTAQTTKSGIKSSVKTKTKPKSYTRKKKQKEDFVIEWNTGSQRDDEYDSGIAENVNCMNDINASVSNTDETTVLDIHINTVKQEIMTDEVMNGYNEECESMDENLDTKREIKFCDDISVMQQSHSSFEEDQLNVQHEAYVNEIHNREVVKHLGINVEPFNQNFLDEMNTNTTNSDNVPVNPEHTSLENTVTEMETESDGNVVTVFKDEPPMDIEYLKGLYNNQPECSF